LYSFDEAPDSFQHWCGDWSGRPRPHEYELVVSFFFEEGDEPCEVAFQLRNRG
jgi:hypothetical protein